MSEQVYLRDATVEELDAEVVDVTLADDGAASVVVDRTIFYATGGGQPHDTGTLGGAVVGDVTKGPAGNVHHLVGGPVPNVGDTVALRINWERRHRLMRTHTALHILGAIVGDRFGAPVTGGNMEPLTGRLDFEMAEVPPNFKADLQTAVDAEVAADRPIVVSFLSPADAAADRSLIRTKVSLVPDVDEVRVVEIVGLDRQADGGTHVASTGEVGSITIGKIESKGKGFRRVRVSVGD